MATKLIDRTPSAYEYPLLIKHILHTPLRCSPHNEIVYKDIKRYDYVTLYKRLGRLANALEGLGIKAGDTVGVMDWDTHRYLECFFAVPMMGAVLHTVNVRLSPEQILYTINHAEDSVLLVNAEFLPLVEKLRPGLKTVKTIIVLTDGGAAPQILDAAGEYESLLEKSPEGYDFPDFDENSMATTFYTTGTTGDPKGVCFSHRQLVLHTVSLAASMAQACQGGLNPGDVYMPLTPMFHVHAWGIPYLAAMLGLKQVYPGRYVPEALLGLIAKEGVTFTHCVPTILHMLLASPAVSAVDLSHLAVIIGGSALPKGLCRAARRKGINIFSGYGMSETCPVLTLAHLKPHMLQWGEDEQIDFRCRAGLPVPLVDVRIVDLDGGEIPHDGTSVGEIVVRAPWLTRGYLKEPQRSEELWENGWLHTADIGSIDQEGYLRVSDRMKDAIKTGGEWISSLQIENILTMHEAVSEAAVIGVPHDVWGERPCALVTVKEEYRGKVGDEELKAFFAGFVEKGVVSKWAIPDRVIIVESIPKTSVGKQNKRLVRKVVAELG
ncbi:MAG: fatty acid--CoA ligase [Syntrophobacteraceae bacterium]|nr:fatty acid--CoA ligase [Syntrophobacteraceae bacterium]